MNEWTPYQTDHLFLLVGTNPLPNYVAALLLAKDSGTVHLLHSGGLHGTTKVATNLKQAIQKQRPQIKEIILREIDDADGGRIAQKMAEILKSIDEQASVGLHYTGGTKAMTVHVYQAVLQRFSTAVFSYLDARTLSLKIDRQGEVQTKSIPVGQACSVKLGELMALHARTLKSSEREAKLRHLYPRLINLHVTSPSDWRKWCEENLKRSDNKAKFKSKTELKRVPLPTNVPPLAQMFEEVTSCQTLEHFPLPDDWKVDDLAEWLDGKWLEHYVLDVVSQIAGACHLHDYGMSLMTEGQSFEFDVAAMCGYQIFALSCTTSSEKGLCKHTLFEAYIRARQMGGDEARVALVCCYQNLESLQKEVEEPWFTDGRVRVFGKPHLSNLPNYLSDWFNTANDARDDR